MECWGTLIIEALWNFIQIVLLYIPSISVLYFSFDFSQIYCTHLYQMSHSDPLSWLLDIWESASISFVSYNFWLRLYWLGFSTLQSSPSFNVLGRFPGDGNFGHSCMEKITVDIMPKRYPKLWWQHLCVSLLKQGSKWTKNTTDKKQSTWTHMFKLVPLWTCMAVTML